jgi:hypothetical protein
LGINLGEPEITVKLENTSVEGVLDSLVTASARKIVIVSFLDSFILTPTGFRRTETLWNYNPVPDDQQPVWDMLHWKEPIPSAVLRRK